MTLLFTCQALSSKRKSGDPYRIRTDVNGVRGRCLNHLTNGPRRRRNSLHFVSAFGENSISAPSFSSLLGKRFAGLPRSFTGDGGNGWGLRFAHPQNRTTQHLCLSGRLHVLRRSSPRAISTGQLHTLPHFHLRPINQVVFLGPYPLSR